MQSPGDRQAPNSAPHTLLIDTAHRQGLVALALGTQVLGERRLDEARRHTRDLVPAMRDLLSGAGWTARNLQAVIVSRGPGSYTGLRVGIMSAKTLAYATGCTLLAVDTFAAIALQAPPEALAIDVIADAQQDKLYIQRFTRTTVGAPIAAATPLAIERFADWQAKLRESAWVTGPGLEVFARRLPSEAHMGPMESWLPRASSLLRLGLERLDRGERDDPFGLEPLYLRLSSAEEKRQQR